MSMIDRYRKKGGFIQLLILIETTGKEKQEKFLKLVSDENPTWEAEVRRKMLSLEKVMTWNPTYLQEIFPRIPVLQLAMVVGGLSPEKAEAFKKMLTYKERKGVEDVLETKVPTPGEAAAGTIKLFAEIRKMVQEGRLKFEKFAQDMVIDENIEENLNSGHIHHEPRSDAPEAASHEVFSTASSNVAATVSSNVSANVSSGVSDELLALRRKLVSLTQDNYRLSQEIQGYKDKLEQIKKIA